jgi:hypothetical protein
MANVAGQRVCEACGRPLPPQHGRGRTRRYCDGKCRDTARRRRERTARDPGPAVKAVLTATSPEAECAAAGGVVSGRDPAAASVVSAARRLLAELDEPGSPQGAVAAARDLSAAADAALQAVVDRARASGLSWREIGDVLGTSRQAAFQRFGHQGDPRSGEPMSRLVPAGAAERANQFLARFTAGRWDEVLADFDDVMRGRHDADRLASGWAQLVGMFGSYQAMGEVVPVQASQATLIDVVLYFEAGEAMVWVRFDRSGKVSGLRLHPASR